jgi:hypothetical protein
MCERKLRSEEEVIKKFDALVRQRDDARPCTAARNMLDQRVCALAWALNHEKVKDLVFDDEMFDFYSCFD